MKNNALKILFLYNGIFVLADSMLGPLYAVFVSGMKGGILPISFSWSAYLVSTTIFTFFISKIGDRIKEKEYLLLAGFAIRSLVWFL